MLMSREVKSPRLPQCNLAVGQSFVASRLMTEREVHHVRNPDMDRQSLIS